MPLPSELTGFSPEQKEELAKVPGPVLMEALGVMVSTGVTAETALKSVGESKGTVEEAAPIFQAVLNIFGGGKKTR